MCVFLHSIIVCHQKIKKPIQICHETIFKSTAYNSIALLTVATFLLAIGLYSAIRTHSPILKDFEKAGWPNIFTNFSGKCSGCIVLCIKKQTKVCSDFLFIKTSKNNFIFLPVFYLVMYLMKAQKNFGKKAILKILELVSSGSAKTHFGKLAMK